MNVLECNSSSCPGWKRVQCVHGQCCSFNYHPLERNKAVMLQQSDRLSSLSILFDGNVPLSGLKLMITPPGTFITHYVEVFFLCPNADNFFYFLSKIGTYTTQFSYLPLNRRKCRLPTDDPSSVYFKSQCTLNCRAEVIHKLCGCHPYYISHAGNHKNIRKCTFEDLICFRDQPGIKNIILEHFFSYFTLTFYRYLGFTMCTLRAKM